MRMLGGLSVQVEKVNALDFDADVLALKHAEIFLGLERDVANLLAAGGRTDLVDDPPARGQFRLVQTGGLISASNVLLVGIEPLHEFTYGSIRELGYRFLSSLVDAPIAVEHLAVTLHGVGFGLEPLEAFRAELLGMADAYVKQEYPESLNRVTFVDRNESSVIFMRSELESLVASHPLVKQALGVSPPAGDDPEKGQVFISYSRADQSVAFQLADDLMGREIPVWLDQIAIKPGEHWDKAVQSALKASNAMLLILSSASANSDNVADEYHYFLQNGKAIIPVLTTGFDMADMPYRLSRLQHIDIEGSYDAALDTLERNLHEALSKGTLATGHF